MTRTLAQQGKPRRRRESGTGRDPIRAFRCSDVLFAHFVTAAAERGTSVAQVIRDAMAHYVPDLDGKTPPHEHPDDPEGTQKGPR